MRSNVQYRFATTQISSVIRNVASEAQEVDFDVKLPTTAFIMAFSMTIDGERYEGQVKDLREAQREYQAAVDTGQSAGHVKQAPRNANNFQITVSVAANSVVNFTLTYQEILRMRSGVYENQIHVSPGQPVQDFRIEVNIRENRPLKFVRTPALRTDLIAPGIEPDNDITEIYRPNPEQARVLYTPSLSDQGGGISARFVVQYEVERAGPGGDVLIVDGYFVHFLVPGGMYHLPKASMCLALCLVRRSSRFRWRWRKS